MTQHINTPPTEHQAPAAPVPSDQIRQAVNAKLEELATKCERLPFSDTASSFAIWIREHKV